MPKKYLFFVSLSYAYPILHPLQETIRKRKDEVAWFIEDNCPVLLRENELQLKTISEVIRYNPIAIFAPGNYIYDFFPGVKVCLFHGYAINKRNQAKDDHFTIRGWFDIYCTQGKSSTICFKKLERKDGSFKVYETGWCKADSYIKNTEQTASNERPTILYSTTFTKEISSAAQLLPAITEMIKSKPWDWLISLHPKINDQNLINAYKKLAVDFSNVTFNDNIINASLLNKIDVLLCDTSSIIIEAMLLDKPVVTFRNTNPGDHLLNVNHENDVIDAIEKAITRPQELMDKIHIYVMKHEAYRDGLNSVRVLDAIDDFILNYKGKLKSKPLNLIRKIKLRWKLKYFHL